MKKKLVTTVCAAAMTLSLAMPAFAGQWISDSNGWWWKNNDGSYPANTWAWLDGNQDGVSECYYFDGNGYCLFNTTTPDGYTVNGDGAWVENGSIRTQGSADKTETSAAAAQYSDDFTGVYTVPFYEMDGSVSSQTVTLAFDPATNNILATFSRWNSTANYAYAGTDFRGFTFFELVSEEEKDALFFSAPGVIEWPSDEGTQPISRK